MSDDINRCTHWSLRVLEFKRCRFNALKVLENEGGPWKSPGICLVGFEKFWG